MTRNILIIVPMIQDNPTFQSPCLYQLMARHTSNSNHHNSCLRSNQFANKCLLHTSSQQQEAQGPGDLLHYTAPYQQQVVLQLLLVQQVCSCTLLSSRQCCWYSRCAAAAGDGGRAVVKLRVINLFIPADNGSQHFKCKATDPSILKTTQNIDYFQVSEGTVIISVIY